MKKGQRLFCFFLVLPMLVLLFACGTKNELGILEKNDEDMIKFDGWGDTLTMSITLVNRIILTGKEGSEFRCSINSGETKEAGAFVVNNRHDATSVTVESGTTVYWFPQYFDGEAHMSEKEVVWLEFINQKDSKIIGYAVVKVNRISLCYYEPEVVKAVTFPWANDVTEEQVAQLIANAEK